MSFLRGLASSSRMRRNVGRVAVASAALLSSGCYQYTATEPGRPVTDQRVELRLNDQGRVAMNRTLGPGASTVEGRVVEQTAEWYSMAVYRLTNVRGDVFTWTGEMVNVPVDGVEMVSERSLDKQRSVVAVASAAGAFAVFVMSRSLIGGGRDTSPGVPPEGQSVRLLP
ncbi:MAG: hypothetical protein KF709_09375 [Gemmatimonadaceae bacterium]|nr:hypothetical protein [Gemmatimonadaceae bacterium]